MFDPMMLEDEMGMDPMMMQQEMPMEPHPSMMPPPLSQNGGIQPKQEFVSPGEMGGGMGDPLFDTLMSNQLPSPAPQDPSMMDMMQGMQGPAIPPPQPPTAMQPPVSDMMQDPGLFEQMMQRQASQGQQVDPKQSQFPPQF